MLMIWLGMRDINPAPSFCFAKPGRGEPGLEPLISLTWNLKNDPTGHFLHSMAGDEGFEPPNGGTRTHCLTTWRIPNDSFGTRL